MGSKTVKSTEKTSGTTTPQLLPSAAGPVNNYFDAIGGFGEALKNGSAASWMPQMNQNLNTAFGMGSSLTNTNDWLTDASGYAKQATAMAGQPNIAMPTLGGPSLAQAPDPFDLAELGDPSDYNVDAAQIGDFGQATAGRGSDYMDDYLDPMTAEIDALLAEYDNDAAEQRAMLEGEALMNKGFGGSGYAIQRGQFDADTTRGRNALRGQMTMDARKTAIGAGLQDASNFSQVGVANSANQLQRNTAQAGLNQQANMRNSELGANYDMAQFDAENALNQLIYGTQAGMNQFNAGSANQFSLADFGMQGDINRANADKRLAENAQRMAGAGLLGELSQVQTQDQLSRIQGLLGLGQAQYGMDAATSPYGLLSAYGDLLNPDGTLNVTTGQNFTGEGTKTSKESGGLLRDILMAAMSNASKIGSMGGGG